MARTSRKHSTFDYVNERCPSWPGSRQSRRGFCKTVCASNKRAGEGFRWTATVAARSKKTRNIKMKRGLYAVYAGARIFIANRFFAAVGAPQLYRVERKKSGIPLAGQRVLESDIVGLDN